MAKFIVLPAENPRTPFHAVNIEAIQLINEDAEGTRIWLKMWDGNLIEYPGMKMDMVLDAIERLNAPGCRESFIRVPKAL
jgi:hypothetical protein